MESTSVGFFFDAPQSVVTVEGLADSGFDLVLDVFTTEGTSSEIVVPSSGTYSLLSASSSAGDISQVVASVFVPGFAGFTDQGTGYFDNLCFSTSINGCGNQVSTGPAGAPEPKTLLLLAIGLLPMLALRRRRGSFSIPE